MAAHAVRFVGGSLFAMTALGATGTAWAQAVGGAEKAQSVWGDPGISYMEVMDLPEFTVLRDYAQPGATRSMHSHDGVKWIVFTRVTGQLLLTVEGEPPIELTQGQVINLSGSARHTFKNTGMVTATIVELFVNPQK